jgi:NADPH2:quinone reductase
MQAMIVRELGEPDVMQLTDLPDPVPGRGEVAIEIRAVGCNFFDILMIQGRYQVRPPLPFSPGSEVAGVVRAVGEGVDDLAPGDRVFGLLGWGGYASMALAPARVLRKLPDAMPFDHAAAFGIVYQTAYFALVYRTDLVRGETLLVHAAAGGVGLAAVQIGRALGARVLATAGSREKCALARAHGAEQAYEYRSPGWVDDVKAATGGRGADVIFDPVGGDVFDLSTKCIAFGGRLLVIGFASGRIPTVQLNRVLLKNISLIGLHWGAYQMHDAARIDDASRALFALYERGEITPVVSSSRPLAEAAAALQEIASRRSVGKVVLVP